jgi:DMSO/TMAO reductase YedYZ heme-binding membrane subunit
MSLVFYLYYKPHGYEDSPIFMLDHHWLIGGIAVSNLYAFAAALVAFFIFLMMTLISNCYAVHALGGVWWRRLLRVGYAGYLAAGLHLSIKNIAEWSLVSPAGGPQLPPLNLLIFLLVCAVIGFRMALTWSLWRQSRKEVSVS